MRASPARQPPLTGSLGITAGAERLQTLGACQGPRRVSVRDDQPRLHTELSEVGQKLDHRGPGHELFDSTMPDIELDQPIEWFVVVLVGPVERHEAHGGYSRHLGQSGYLLANPAVALGSGEATRPLFEQQ